MERVQVEVHLPMTLEAFWANAMIVSVKVSNTHQRRVFFWLSHCHLVRAHCSAIATKYLIQI